MSLYLFGGVYIDFDYKQNIVTSDAAIISKNFGTQNYSRNIDSIMLNTHPSKLNSRIFVSSEEPTDLNTFKVTTTDGKVYLPHLLEEIRESKKEIIIYCDKETYAKMFIWFFKTMFPTIQTDTIYKMYRGVLIAARSLSYLDYEDYILDELIFKAITNKVQPYTGEYLEDWKLSINIVLKIATIKSGRYNLQQVEDLKQLLYKQSVKFYKRTFQRTYRLLVENFNTFKKDGFLYEKDKKIVWQISPNIIIDDFNDIEDETVINVFNSKELVSEDFQDSIEQQIVGDKMSFKRIFSMKQETYDRYNARYRSIIKVDPLHWFFASRSLEKYNILEFIDYMINFNLNSDLFSSNSFPGLTQVLANYIVNELRVNTNLVQQFSTI